MHHGNTVTDCLSQERERGITICSSAVSLQWKNHRINVLDTPGHIDFTMEVEQSLSAVDGAVVILDSSAGVEAQTITVWNQADRHKLPRIVFANKMDRKDADFDACLIDLKMKLEANPIPIQWPLQKDQNLNGIIDLITFKKMTWNPKDSGQSYQLESITDDYDFFLSKRNQLVDVLSNYDDELAELIITNNSFENIDSKLLISALRRGTNSLKFVPVLLGSAYKNIGVQPLIDGIVNYLPAPNQRNSLYDCFGDDFVGKVFKVTHDKQRGPLSLVRVLRGNLKKGNRVIGINGLSENIQRIYDPLADEYREVSEIVTGDVGVCAGMKNTTTGDLLVSNMSSLRSAQKRLKKMLEKQHFSTTTTKDSKAASQEEDEDLEYLSNTFSLSPRIPDAVYFCSVEPPSSSQQLALENALKQLQREDPSLRVRYDDTTMQTVLGGMGELHMEIIKSRLMTEYKIDAELGPLQIAYRETLQNTARDSISVEKEIAGNRQQVSIDMSLQFVQSPIDAFKLDSSPEATQNLSLVRPRFIGSVKKGAIGALERGPLVGGPVIDTQIILHNLTIGRGTADSFIMATAAQCVQKILVQAGCQLLEPIMSLEILTPSEKVSTILSDLSRRRSTILDVKPRGELNKVIEVLAPLSELEGYSSVLRTISSGIANVSMQPKGYAKMTEQFQYDAIEKSKGLA